MRAPTTRASSQMLAAIDRVERGVREEHRTGRGEAQSAFAGFDERLPGSPNAPRKAWRAAPGPAEDARAARHESGAGLQRFEVALQSRLEKLNETTERRLGEVRLTLEGRLKELQQDNAAKLEQMRQTVDEKLHATLEAAPRRIVPAGVGAARAGARAASARCRRWPPASAT